MLNSPIVPNLSNIERVEVIYDMNSTDPAINWIASGITNGMVFTVDLSKYKMLRCQYQSYNNAIVAFCDLTTPTTPKDKTGRYLMYAIGNAGIGLDEFITEIDLEKKHLKAAYLPGSGVFASFISKIEGIY